MQKDEKIRHVRKRKVKMIMLIMCINKQLQIKKQNRRRNGDKKK